MPVSAAGVLQNVGDTVSVSLGTTGIGQPTDPTAIFSLTGTFTSATVAFEAVPVSQPLVQGSPPTPDIPGRWIPIAEVGVIDGQLYGSPVSNLTSLGTAGTGYAFTVSSGGFTLIRMRLVSIGSGAIQGGIATVPFPVSQGQMQQNALLAGIQLEMTRIRLGIGILIDTDLKDAVPLAGAGV